MDSAMIYNSITVTTLGNQSEIQFSVQHLEGDQTETISLSVIVPAVDSRSLTEIQNAAMDRAIVLLKSALKRDPLDET